MAKITGNIFFAFFFTFCCLLSASPAFASKEFVTQYDVAYKIHPSGLTTITQNVSLTNKFSNIYATKYDFSTGTLNIQNVKAWNNLGNIETNVNKKNGTTTVELLFNNKVVGRNKTLNFTLQYETLDFVSKKGKIWEIVTPKITGIEKIEKYRLILDIPLSFGKPAYLSPKPIKKQSSLYIFDKRAAAKGITAAFGDFQIFDFEISYNLENPEMSFREMQIAVPPDTLYQKIIYKNIKPKPEKITVNEDGNWLANYKLKPKENLKIIVTGSAQIFLKPNSHFQLSTTDYANYLKSQKYWEVDDPEIQRIAKNLRTPQKIYNFVIKTLNYDYERITKAKRLGAKKALLYPNNALCMEFTDLFIALSRAAGIPAREINGFAYTENPRLKSLSVKRDILHAWPEYWDKKKKNWIHVDPTWEETSGGIDFFNKFDLKHLTFVIHGTKSNFPQPPGKGPQKNIKVSFAKTLPKIKEGIKTEFKLPHKAIAGFQILGTIKIANTGNSALKDLNANINSEPYKIKVLPPFTSRFFPITIPKTHWWESKKEKIAVDVNQYHSEDEINIQPFFLQINVFLTKLLSSVTNLIR